MERKRFARLSQRLGALLLAGVTLWTVYATAGSVDAAGAWMAVKRERAAGAAPVAVRGHEAEGRPFGAVRADAESGADLAFRPRGDLRPAASDGGGTGGRASRPCDPAGAGGVPARSGDSWGRQRRDGKDPDPHRSQRLHRLREGLHPKHHPIYPLQRGAAEALRGGADRRSAANPDSAQPWQRGLYPGGG